MQLRAFTEAAERARRRRLADEVSNMRAAQYDKKHFTDYLKALSDG
jgi:hypothetical protein